MKINLLILILGNIALSGLAVELSRDHGGGAGVGVDVGVAG